MRLFLLLLVLTAAVLYALETEHFIVTPDDPVLAKYLENAYSYYRDRGLSPAPPCGGSKYVVYIDPSSPYDGYTEFGGGCIIKVVFKPSYTMRLVYHEVGHVFFASYDLSNDYFWVDEATPEAMASVATGVYYFPDKYFSDRLYRVNPFSLGEDRIYDWYKYSAVVAWYLQNTQSWADILRNFSTRQGAASLYVRFLLALNKGITLGQKTYVPDRERVEVAPGSMRIYPDLPGFTAAYYEVVVPQSGVLKITAFGDGVDNMISNIALNRDILVTNGTLLLAVVNNSSETLRPTLVFYLSSLQAKVVDGLYADGKISVRLYATYNLERVNGVVKVNGTPVEFLDGIATYNFTGPLKPYVLKLEYNDSRAYIYLNLSQPLLSVMPNILYLDEGGHGVLNVTLKNPNPIAVRCSFDSTGLRLVPIDIFLPSGNTTTFKLGFWVTDIPQGRVKIRCGPASTEVSVFKPTYSLDFNLDTWSGVLSVRVGSTILNYSTKLPANISISYDSYIVTILRIPMPKLVVNVSSPRLVGNSIGYTLRLKVEGPPWAKFRGTVRLNNEERGSYSGGVFSLDIQLQPGVTRDIGVAIGKLETRVTINVPNVETEIIPKYAVVRNDNVILLAEIKHNIEGNADVEFHGMCKRLNLLEQDAVVLNCKYNDTLVVSYTSFHRERYREVYLPKPRVSITFLHGVVSPEKFNGLFNITVEVCNPSVDSRYEIDLDSKRVVLHVKNGTCASNYAIVEFESSYSPMLVFNLTTFFGSFSQRLFIPPPAVEYRLRRWVIQGNKETALVDLLVEAAKNYTYVVMGREISGRDSLSIEVEATGGVAVVKYGFGTIHIPRPPLQIITKPILLEVNTSATLDVEVKVPTSPELYINASLTTNFGLIKQVSLHPGISKFKLEVPKVSKPGVYNLSIAIGPYVNYTEVTVYQISNISIIALPKVPVGYPVRLDVKGYTNPPGVVRVSLTLNGCIRNMSLVRLNSSLVLKIDRPCAINATVSSNTTKAVVKIEWASLTAELRYYKLGVLRNIPIFPIHNFSVTVLLGDTPVDGHVRVVGDFDKLGFVNYTIYVEYMGMVNRTSFVGFAVPINSYIAANKTVALLSPKARPYFIYLIEKAVTTGDWSLVDGISKLYSDIPTPFTIVARFLVEKALEDGREPNIYVIESLRKIEPVLLGIVGGVFLAMLRRVL
ncbi:conserved hypothetical protein [Pyrobaculum islandicum DSM 4184]|uniref:Uncharacterized protein n=1 Tax=Pyrobaculum islandicum (strain DSM 4184 / JCM 9189 / GEO3) TaxID=384616 RepID=A1RTJ8_PYRIL|nr:hypothetical protein [Pyrobaculum islandicum]ABL88280.1 conserved hypothetical protein [Pyrobaculum islandicum DSM 4184]